VFIDAIMVKIRDGQVRNRPVYAAIGVDLDGHKDILGMWAGDGDGESAKSWMAVLTELKNRGVHDVFFVVCDGLKGLPDSVNTVFPLATVQTCIIHLIRGSFRYASRKYWDELSRDLKPIYQAANAEAAAMAMDQLQEKWGTRYPAPWPTGTVAWSVQMTAGQEIFLCQGRSGPEVDRFRCHRIYMDSTCGLFAGPG
jgi:transposase-like protein